MVSDISQSAKSLPVLVSKLIVFRFVNIEPTDYTKSFSWLALKGASNYIVQLSNSQGIVFREKVAATNSDIETFSYQDKLLNPGGNYLFTVEVDLPSNNIDFCNVNNENTISEYVKQGISNIKSLNLSDKSKANLIAQLDSLLIARNEIINIVSSVIQQGSNSDIICFLNYFLAQGSAFELLINASCVDEVINAFSEIATQLASANITLSEYLQLSGVQIFLADNIIKKGTDLALFAQNTQRVFQFNQLTLRITSNRCDPICFTERYSPIRCFAALRHICGGCEDCDPSNP